MAAERGTTLTELQRYLAEEVAEDHADGIITRREAMRRLGLLGVTASAATAMLTRAAEAAAAPRRPASRPRHGDGRTEEWAPVPREDITFPGPRSTLMGAWAPAEHSRGGVLVIHENRGLTEHIREVAGRFAANGWSALALDLLSEQGGTGSFPDEAAVGAALSGIPPENFDADMQAALTELQRRLPGQGLAAIGFCFGGGMVWRLVTSGEQRLDAAAPFYGPFPEGERQISGRPAVLGVYAGLDDRVNATRDAARAALEAARVRHKILVFTEAQHAFFNNTNPDRFNAPAAAEAWRRVDKWFGRHVDHDHDDDDDHEGGH
ncbi:MAG TPA: dienelactone hydrolase family protein [Solirubrobacteraceae bacterium]|nr:dienelactone hydrolase family protein [Solirubrobacteraceae bacterium]